MLTSFYPYPANTRTNIVLRMTNSKTNSASDGYTAYAPDTSFWPTTVSDYMLFNGSTNIVRYQDKPEWHFTPPYSIEFEMYADDISTTRWVATEGEGFQVGWPEWAVMITGGGLQFNSSTTNNGDTTSVMFMPTIQAQRWYKIGIMYYTDSSSNPRVRGYVNGGQVFDTPCAIPYNTTSFLAFGGDAAKYAARAFKGRLRNITMAQSLFWTV